MSTTIVLADDHALVRNGIKSLLEDQPDLVVVGEADDGDEALQVVAEQNPDLLIIDIRMPRVNGIEAVRTLKQRGNTTPCLMLSMHDSEEYVLQSIQAGAHGYLLKDTSKEEFLKAIRTISSGERYFSGDLSHILVRQLVSGSSGTMGTSSTPPTEDLTRREQQILRIVLTGATNQEIADQLGLSRRTVETHRFNMMKKLGVNNLAELSRIAQQLRLI